MSSGTKNSAGDFIRFIFSTLVNKDDEIFKALFANPDDESGAIERMFNLIEESRNEWCNNSDVYNQSGEMLEKSISYFSVLERIFAESDESFKNRNELLFYRNGDTVWGDKWDILSIFKTWFNTQDVFIINDTDDISENMFLDGDFEEENSWTLENCNYDVSAGFCGKLGILFNAPGSCSQNVNVDIDAAYFVHFFLNGHIGVQIKDDNGRCWDSDNGEFGSWVSTAKTNHFTTSKWDAGRLFFLTDGQVHNVTVSFIGIDDGISMIDYARLFRKGNYSSFTLVAVFAGKSAADTLAMGPEGEDPVESVNYDLMSYIEHANIFGTSSYSISIYKELLDIVKAGGIWSYMEILIRD
jgi:hypothetical protein